MGEFVLRIKLGNDAMQTASDVARALRELADKLDDANPTVGVIYDDNGNRVGSWQLEGELP